MVGRGRRRPVGLLQLSPSEPESISLTDVTPRNVSSQNSQSSPQYDNTLETKLLPNGPGVHVGDNENGNVDSTSPKLKCVLVGDGAIGKTSLVVSYTTNGYPTEYVPTAFDNYTVSVSVDQNPIYLQLCDTAGQDDFDSLRPLCYPNTDVFLLCFSVVSPTSFYNITEKWLPEIKQHCSKVPLILVGMQCDLRSDVKVLIELANYNEQPVPESDAKALAHRIKARDYIECSALTQKNLKEVFDTAIVHAMETSGLLGKKKGKQSKFKASFSLPKHENKKGWKRFCCAI